MEYFALYILGNIGWIRDFLTTGGLMVGLSIVLFTFVRAMEFGIPFVLPIKPLIACSIVFIVGWLLPTERSIQYMAAYYVGNRVVETDMSKKLIELVNKRLEKEISNTKTR